MNDRALQVLVVFAGVAIAVAAVFGWVWAGSMQPAPRLQARTTPFEAAPEVEQIRVESAPCRMTSGIDAALYCNGLPDAWFSDPGIDLNVVAEKMENVRQCAVDTIVEIKALHSPHEVSEAEVLELLHGVVTYYPPSSNDLDIANLQMGLYHLVNDYLNR